MKLQRTALSVAAMAAMCLATAGALAAPPDTSAWTCSLCPADEKGVTGAVDLGVGAVVDSQGANRSYAGLGSRDTHGVLGGGLQFRSGDGLQGSIEGQDLGLRSRALSGDIGQQGVFRARLGYAEITRHTMGDAKTPFLGVGGDDLTLPAGYPALSTATMPLAATLQPVDVQSRRRRLDAGLSWTFSPDVSAQLSARHDVRDGLQRLSGSFFANASQLWAPLDQTIDSVAASADFRRGALTASVGYQGSWFRNDASSLTWTNPFQGASAGTQRGQMALAPDNAFNQVMAAAAYDLGPTLRVSGDVAWGQMTQDAALLSASLNPALAATLPAASLAGRVNTFNGNARITGQVSDVFRLTATYARDARDNRTRSLAWPAVITDTEIDATARVNQPFSFTRDLFRFTGEYKGPGSLRTSGGIDYDRRDRTLQEVATTQELTGWLRASVQTGEATSLSMKLWHASRDPDQYGSVAWINPPENPLLRKFNMAARQRDALQARADTPLTEYATLAVNLDVAKDRYTRSTIGLTSSASLALGADLSVAISDKTQVHGYLHVERIDSRQAGSHLGTAPWWTARTVDAIEAGGVGVRHLALKGKLELAADLTLSRGHSDVRVDTGAADPDFPTNKTALDGLRLAAAWQFNDRVTLAGSYWYEFQRGNDWHLDGVTASTVPVLLAAGDAATRYRINVLRVALRVRF